MPHPTGPTNSEAVKLVSELRRAKLADLARRMSRPARARKAVSLARIAKLGRKSSVFVVPGKVVGKGEVGKISVYAFSFSRSARDSINRSGSALSLREFIRDRPKAYVVK